MVFVPWPVATHNEFPKVISLPHIENIVVPKPVHVVPWFVEYASVFVVDDIKCEWEKKYLSYFVILNQIDIQIDFVFQLFSWRNKI